MIDDIKSASVSQDDLSLLALYPRGKRMRRAGAFMVKGKTVEEERTVIKLLKQTPASDDCGQSSNPTIVTHSTTYTINNKRKATLQNLPNEVRKKQKRPDSTPVTRLQVKQAPENMMDLLPTFAPVLNIPDNCSRKSRSDPQRHYPLRRTSKSNPWRRSSLPTILEPFYLALGSEKLEYHDNEQSFTPHGGLIFREPDEMDYEQEYHATIEQAGTGVIKRATIQYQVKTEQRVHDSKQEGSSISPTEVLDGRRRALVVAIQYEDGQEWPRKGFSMRMVGPYADADDICELLVDQGYDRQDIQVMTDKPGTHADDMPTRDNITNALSELVAWARPGDHLFLYFAGHGTQIEDQDGDEDDGKDETIIPCDWATRFQHRDEGLIVDDLLRRNCINRLPAGSQLTAVFDSCHAGTILDLPETYPKELYIQLQTPFKERLSDPHGKVAARVLCFAACMDSQKAYSQGMRGQFTQAFTKTMREHKSKTGSNPTIQHLFECLASNLRELLKIGKLYQQNPLLTSSFRIVADELGKSISL